MTESSIYLSMRLGERLKIDIASEVIKWAVVFGEIGYSMALSSDGTYLIAGSHIGADAYIGSLNEVNGALMR